MADWNTIVSNVISDCIFGVIAFGVAHFFNAFKKNKSSEFNIKNKKFSNDTEKKYQKQFLLYLNNNYINTIIRIQ